MKRYLIAGTILVFICSGLYAATTSPTDTSSAASTTTPKQGSKKGKRGGNSVTKDMRKKLHELNKFYMDTVKQNLKVDVNTISDSINKKITELGLSIAAFDTLRASVTKDMERSAINELENRFLEFQKTLNFLVKGLPKFEQVEAQETSQQQAATAEETATAE